MKRPPVKRNRVHPQGKNPDSIRGSLRDCRVLSEPRRLFRRSCTNISSTQVSPYRRGWLQHCAHRNDHSAEYFVPDYINGLDFRQWRRSFYRYVPWEPPWGMNWLVLIVTPGRAAPPATGAEASITAGVLLHKKVKVTGAAVNAYRTEQKALTFSFHLGGNWKRSSEVDRRLFKKTASDGEPSSRTATQTSSLGSVSKVTERSLPASSTSQSFKISPSSMCLMNSSVS